MSLRRSAEPPEPDPANVNRMSWLPETKSHAWEQAGLAAQVLQRDARRARIEALFVIPAIVGVLVVFNMRGRLLP